jgi:uncharacterized membrane protein
MSETPVQVIVAAFSDTESAGRLMDDLKQGKKEGLIGIIDAAVVVKDAEGKLKVTDARRRSRRVRGLLTGGVVGGVVGLLAGPVGWAALGGSAVGALAGRLAGVPTKKTMENVGEALTPNSSAIVAVIEHTWVAHLEAAIAAEGAQVISDVIAADIAAQLQAGGNVLYTAGAGPLGEGIARIAEGPDGVQVSSILAGDEGVMIMDAQFTDEHPTDDEPEAAGD